MKLRRILVPIDFSPVTKQAIALARAVAPARTPLVLLHVVQPMASLVGVEAYGMMAPGFDFLAEQEKLARRRLEQIAARLRRGGATVRTQVRIGDPATVIVEAAEKLAASLVVIGTQGRTGLSHLLLGSVAEKVVRLAAVPVLSVRSPRAAARKRKPRARAAKRTA